VTTTDGVGTEVRNGVNYYRGESVVN